ncbi:hypothetical protein TNCV_3782681 [Trichonephila clavipes]|nr:hypothetical protein TNCV_3782681 [Trichonephila clavipes]
MFGSRSLQLDEWRQASRRSFEAWILTSWKVPGLQRDFDETGISKECACVLSSLHSLADKVVFLRGLLIMDSLGHSSIPPTALGRQDDEEVTSVFRMAEWIWHRTPASFAECGHHLKRSFSYSRIAEAER